MSGIRNTKAKSKFDFCNSTANTRLN